MSIAPSTVSEPAGVHSGVRMLGCTILQRNSGGAGLRGMCKGASMQAVLRDGGLGGVVLDCGALPCLRCAFGSLIGVRGRKWPHSLLQ